MKKTAVEWLVEQMKKYNMTVSVHNTSHQNVMDFYKAIEQAKEMENERVTEAYRIGRIGKSIKEFNETFKSE